tara:strand:- start:209 stop:499 length:291 start_codon:yes stop_codon:yes gene_type:complete
LIAKTENELFKAIITIDSIDECKNFFYDLCTPSEIEEFSTRWLIVKLLSKKKPYRQIALETGVSTTTVGRVARYMKYGHDGYNTILNKLYLDKKKI